MNHKGTKTIETKRLLLRKFNIKDAVFMYNNWANDDEVTRYITWPTHKDLAESEFFVRNVIKGYTSEKYQWAIVFKENNEVIGDISAPRIFIDIESIEMGYVIGKKYWNKGIATEALNALIHFFIKEVGANRIEAKHDIKNPASGEVMKKCGMKFEGILRQAGKNNAGICDLAVYSVLKEDVKF